METFYCIGLRWQHNRSSPKIEEPKARVDEGSIKLLVNNPTLQQH